MRTLTFLFTLSCLIGFSRPVAAQADRRPNDLIDQQILVMFEEDAVTVPGGEERIGLEKANVPPSIRGLLRTAEAQELIKALPAFQRRDTLRVLDDGRIYRVPDYTNLYVITLPRGANRDSVVARLARLPGVVYAEKNQRAEPRVDVIPTNESQFNLQWGLRNTSGPDIEATQAWSITKGSNSIKVGVVDTGVMGTHIDLSGKVTGTTTDADGHGTHVAGIIAAKGENPGGYVVGVDWNAQLVAAQTGSLQATAAAINTVVSSGVKVINNSWGYADESATLSQALRSAYDAGVLLVHANSYQTGNANAVSSYPNNLGPWIVNVGAMASTGAAWNNTGSRYFTDVGAPGVNITSTYINGATTSLTGTSMAAPHVAGTASLLLAANSNLRNYDIEHLLKRTAQNYPTFSTTTGYGMINAYAAVQKVIAPNTVAHGTASFTKLGTSVNQAFTASPAPTIAAGNYIVDYYEMKATASYQYQSTPWAWLPITEKGLSAANPNNGAPYLSESISSTSLTIKTYFYFIKSTSGGQTVNKWAPFDPTAYRRNGIYEFTIIGVPAPTPPVPPAPANLTVTGTTGQHPHLTWTASPGATGYRVYRCSAISYNCSSYFEIGTTPNTTYDDLNKTIGTSCGVGPDEIAWYYVKAYNSGGTSGASNSASTCIDAGKTSPALTSLPAAYALRGNHPNPFNPSTEIRFDLPETASVRLVVYDVIGREVARLVDGVMESGFQSVTWNADDLPSGVYLYRLQAGSFMQTRSMILQK